MANSVKSSSLEPAAHSSGESGLVSSQESAPTGWLKVGAIAAASALLGGLAAAWFYRKTLSQLQEAGNGNTDSLMKITENETEEDF